MVVKDLRVKIWNIIEKIVYFFLDMLFRITGKELSDDIFMSFMQFAKFGIVGASNTILSYVIYVVSLLGFQKWGIFSKVDYLVSSFIGFVLSVLWSFYWNNKMVFTLQQGEKRSVWKSLVKTFVSYSFTGLFLSNVLLVLWVHALHISEFTAPIINLFVTVPLNFVINKFWTFKARR